MIISKKNVFLSLFFLCFFFAFNSVAQEKDSISFSGFSGSFATRVGEFDKVLFGIVSTTNRQPQLSDGKYEFKGPDFEYAELRDDFRFYDRGAFYVDLALGKGTQLTPNAQAKFSREQFVSGRYYFFVLRRALNQGGVVNGLLNNTLTFGKETKVEVDYVQLISSVPYAFMSKYAEQVSSVLAKDFVSPSMNILNVHSRFLLDDTFRLFFDDSKPGGYFGVNTSNPMYTLDVQGTLNIRGGSLMERGSSVDKPYFTSKNKAISLNSMFKHVVLYDQPYREGGMGSLKYTLDVQGAMNVSVNGLYVGGKALTENLQLGWVSAAASHQHVLYTSLDRVGLFNVSPTETLDIAGGIRLLTDNKQSLAHKGVVFYGTPKGKTEEAFYTSANGRFRSLHRLQGEGLASQLAYWKTSQNISSFDFGDILKQDSALLYFSVDQSKGVEHSIFRFGKNNMGLSLNGLGQVAIATVASIVKDVGKPSLAVATLNVGRLLVKGHSLRNKVVKSAYFVTVNQTQDAQGQGMLHIAYVPNKNDNKSGLSDRVFLSVNDPLIRQSGARSDYAYKQGLVATGSVLFLGSVSSQNAVFASSYSLVSAASSSL